MGLQVGAFVHVAETRLEKGVVERILERDGCSDVATAAAVGES